MSGQSPDAELPAAQAPAAESPSGHWCAWCSAAVRLVQTVTGVLMPIDPEPHPAGRIRPMAAPGGGHRAQILTREQCNDRTRPLWRSHYETCPRAADPDLTSPGSLLPLSRYACPQCGQPLPIVLLTLGQASHPGCRAAAADIGLVAGRVTTSRLGCRQVLDQSTLPIR